eukprot:TRINITY_DN6046_c0_g2_i1.p2 TRINITY_DN6046_c0_g2~~TRINITY_DN6046_c0_g2_i1.p2  ORF type:complete len:102 (-),score=30.89 TRINITY_DN6046_c0_g2_i1:283-588(-)
MVFNVLFGSRLLPKAMMQRAATMQVQKPAVRFASTAVASVGTGVAPSVAVATGAAPRVGSRIWYRRPGWQGPGGWVLWLTGWTACAGFMQEIAGPYIFFHE